MKCNLQRRTAGLVLVCAAFAPFAYAADSALGEFQRGIEHDRAFQREMDAQRTSTDAINKPSSYTPPPSQAISAQAWLGALDEQKRREADANAARIRAYNQSGVRAAEAARAAADARRASAAQFAQDQAAEQIAARPLIAAGIAPGEALSNARFLAILQTGTYFHQSTPQVREAIAKALVAKATFDDEFTRPASYNRLAALAAQMESGFDGWSATYGSNNAKYFCLPLASIRARVRLVDRFKFDTVADDLAVACARWPDSGRFGGVATEERDEVLAAWVRAVGITGRGERELATRLNAPDASPYLANHPALVAQLRSSAYQRTLARLTTGNLNDQDRVSQGNAVLGDIAAMTELHTAAKNWPGVLEWQLRAFELPGLNITLAGQAAFRALLTAHPELLAQFTAAQWTRLAAARDLAIPDLLRELPQHLDPATQPLLLRNVYICRAAQAEDRVAALTLAYECRRADDGTLTDPVGFVRALGVAAAALRPDAAPAQILAAQRARALEAFVRTNWSAETARLAVAEGAAAGVRESIFVSVLLQLRQKPSAEQRAALRQSLDQLGAAPLWSSHVYTPSPRNLLGFAWSEDSAIADGLQRALPIWREGAAAGDVTCMAALGLTLTNREAQPSDWPEGRLWLDRAADLGEPGAALRKGILVFHGRCGYSADPSSTAPLFRRGSAASRSSAPYYLGLIYARGLGVEKNPADALLYWQAVQSGDFKLEAALEIADAHARGLGTPEDQVKAVTTIRLFAEAGDARAQNLLGTFLSKKFVPDISPEAAFPWWRKSAAQGLFLAARNLYAAQTRGSPGPANPAAALAEFEQFLETATPASRHLGGLLLLHEGNLSFTENTRNEPRGRLWITRAAEAGHAPAKAWLAAHPTSADAL